MGRIYYHIPTKNLLNEHDIHDLMSVYEDGDMMYKTEAGNATLETVSDEEIQSFKEFIKEENEEDN